VDSADVAKKNGIATTDKIPSTNATLNLTNQVEETARYEELNLKPVNKQTAYITPDLANQIKETAAYEKLKFTQKRKQKNHATLDLANQESTIYEELNV